MRVVRTSDAVRRILLFAVAALGAVSAANAATFYQKAGYKAFKDSQFFGVPLTTPDNFVCGYFYLETFEDNALNTPGVKASTGKVVWNGNMPNLTDSVDEDDESMTQGTGSATTNGSGLNGHSYFASDGQAGIVFTFDSTILGGYPTHVGIVWTDGANPVTVTYTNGAGTVLTPATASPADAFSNGQTAEDHFFGVYDGAGIKSFKITSGTASNGIEVDHLQYGRLLVSSCNGCCKKIPAFTASQAGFPGTAAVATQQGNFGFDVVSVVGIRPEPAPTAENWSAAPFYVPGGLQNWTQANLGTAFGETLDDQGNIYVTHSSIYGVAANSSSLCGQSGGNPCGDVTGALAGAGPNATGTLFKIDSATGVPAVFAQLPNGYDCACEAKGQAGAAWQSCLSGSSPCPGPPHARNTECYPGLGDVCFSCQHRMIYVSNFEDGRIYALDMSGAVKYTWNHSKGITTVGPPAAFTADGWAGLGKDYLVYDPLGHDRDPRVWAVQVHQGRLFYSVWGEDQARPLPFGQHNNIWSVALDALGKPLPGTEKSELNVPVYSLNGVGKLYSNPVSDISFPPGACCMLLAERTMASDTTSCAHSARQLEYCQNQLVFPTKILKPWVRSGKTFRQGTGVAPFSSAGGNDYDYTCPRQGTTRVQVWGTADAIKFQDPGSDRYVYGLCGEPSVGDSPIFAPGNTAVSAVNTTSKTLMIDLDQNTQSGDKWQQGDVEVSCLDCRPDATGSQCIGQCLNGNSCVPERLVITGGSQRIASCWCAGDQCQLRLGKPASCIGPCSSPNVCSLKTSVAGLPPGTREQTCECEPPVDNDGDVIIDALDDCPNVANPTQTDTDADGLGDSCDPCPASPTNGSFYADSDGDGYGNPLSSVTTGGCPPPVGYVEDSSDCIDTNAMVHPGAVELCDGLDNDCNATVDDLLPVSGSPVLHASRLAGGVARFSWAAVPGATAYDVVQGGLARLLQSGGEGNFSASTAGCQAHALAATSTDDPLMPPVGQGFWYLVRTVACSVPGSYDTGSPRQVASRDPEIENAEAACPTDVRCNSAADCEDGNGCTTETCVSQRCVFTAVSCDDGDVCTADFCDDLTGCVSAPIDCDDANACTIDSCAPVVGCVHDALNCDDFDPCTLDACDPATGCVHTPNCGVR